MRRGAKTFHRLRVTLRGAYRPVPDPPVWRTLLVSSDATFAELHEIFQVALDWSRDESHLHEFREVNEGRRGGRAVGHPELWSPWMEDESEVRLQELLPRVRMHLLYEYDLGNCWRHEVRVEKVEHRSPGDPFVILLKGEGTCPDSDGPFNLQATQERVAKLSSM